MWLLIALVLPAWAWAAPPTCRTMYLDDDGPHVCYRFESYQEAFSDSRYDPRIYTTKKGWCWFPFGWFCRTVSETRYEWNDYTSYRTNYRQVRECCEGYISSYDNCHEICPCASNPCLNNAACSNHEGAFVCDCSEGFEGARCGIEIDPCASNPCMNNGTCTKSGRAYACDCSERFKGASCEVEINPCASNPCMNNGTCAKSGQEFICHCSVDFEGIRCDIVSMADPDVTSGDSAPTVSGGSTGPTPLTPDVELNRPPSGSVTFIVVFCPVSLVVVTILLVFLIRKRYLPWPTPYRRLQNPTPEE